jgi:hypothetical protein
VQPAAPSLGAFVARAEARRGLAPPEAAAAAAAAAEAVVVVASAQDPGRDGGAPASLPPPPPPAPLPPLPPPAPLAPDATWLPAWLPLHYGAAARAVHERRLTSKLGELDEALGISPQQSLRELDDARGALAATARSRGGART